MLIHKQRPVPTDYGFKSNCAAGVLTGILQRSMYYEPTVQLIVTMDFQGAKRPGCGIELPRSSTEVIKSKAIPLLPVWAFMICSRVNFIFFI
jgi:hypothetical protein